MQLNKFKYHKIIALLVVIITILNFEVQIGYGLLNHITISESYASGGNGATCYTSFVMGGNWNRMACSSNDFSPCIYLQMSEATDSSTCN